MACLAPCALRLAANPLREAQHRRCRDCASHFQPRFRDNCHTACAMVSLVHPLTRERISGQTQDANATIDRKKKDGRAAELRLPERTNIHLLRSAFWHAVFTLPVKR